MSLYDGDYGLMKVYQLNDLKYPEIYGLLGLKSKETLNTTYICVPQSWMASIRPNSLIQYKKPLYVYEISKIPTDIQTTVV